MRIDDTLLRRIVDHALAEMPNECCGLMELDAGGVVLAVFAAENIAASPYRFEIAARDLLRITEIDDRGNRPAVYHSHPLSEPVPSQTDINFAAAWPGMPWLIVGLAAATPQLRCWQIDRGEVVERPIEYS